VNLWSHGKGRKVLENQDLLHIAVGASERAATFIREAKRPEDPSAWGRKGLNDFVTEVDREAERLVTEYLLEHAPDSQIRGEELSPETDSDDLVWVVDPLDGTTNYLHDYPAYAVSIAAVRNRVPQVGVVVDVVRDQTYTASSNGGAWLGDSRLAVSSVSDPSAALVGTGFPFKVPPLLPQYLDQLSALMHETSGIRRAGSAALDLVDVAQGRFDGFWELQLAPWDVAAGTLLVREAGGIVTDTDGSHDVVKHGSIVAGNPAMHQWLLKKVEAVTPQR
jgi:myo-inositol-1(or 4)-monophosphatase